MDVLWILANVLLGVMLWDIHRGVTTIAAIAERVADSVKDLHDKTDALLHRTPPAP